MSERKSTNALYALVEDGMLDKDTVIRACINFMSEDEVATMCSNEEFLPDELDDEV